ncbi:MAG TPA: hypothetical protein VMV05_06070 [bacterium]|nr:hypothetical protein [bacterium]
MAKFFILIQRAALIAGVLVALTPCNFCQKAGMASTAMAHCSMKHKTGHDCCRSKKTSPFCQVMDQSSVPAASVQVHAPAVQVAPFEFAALPVLRTVQAFSAVSSSSPPLRGPLALRI